MNILERVRTRISIWFHGPQSSFEEQEKDATNIIQQVRANNLSYCGPPKLENIAKYLLQVKQNGVSGDILEAGVALGGSAILLGKLKPRSAKLKLFDVFATIPAPSERDEEDAHARYEVIKQGKSDGLGNDTYYGYVDDLLEKVKQNIRKFGLNPDKRDIEFYPGLFEDTLNIDEPIAFAHIDCDWYDSVTVCIDRITPHIPPGGVIIFDDYSSYLGCTKAVDEFLGKSDKFEILFHERSLGLLRLNK